MRDLRYQVVHTEINWSTFKEWHFQNNFGAKQTQSNKIWKIEDMFVWTNDFQNQLARFNMFVDE